jgi:hypothetical protein
VYENAIKRFSPVRVDINIVQYLAFIDEKKRWENDDAPDPRSRGRAPANCNHFAFISAALLAVGARTPVIVIQRTRPFFVGKDFQHALNAIRTAPDRYRFFDTSIYERVKKSSPVNPRDIDIEVYGRRKDGLHWVRHERQVGPTAISPHLHTVEVRAG